MEKKWKKKGGTQNNRTQTRLSIKIEIQCRVLKSDPQDPAGSRRTKLVNY